jgi:hypothetical protein
MPMKLSTLYRMAGVLAALALPALAQVPVGYVQVTASNLTNSSGTKILNATIAFAPVDNQGRPISYQVNGSGQAHSQPVRALVTSGAMQIQLADTALTRPQNICFSTTITDNISGRVILSSGYECFQPAGSGPMVTLGICSAATGTVGGTCNFDKFVPNLPGQAVIQTGPQGPPGTPGAPGPNCATGSPAGTCDMQGANITNAGTVAASATVVAPLFNGAFTGDGSGLTNFPLSGNIGDIQVKGSSNAFGSLPQSTFLKTINNLSDVASTSTARSNLGAAASNAPLTINGQSCSLGASCTVPSTPLNPRGAYNSATTYNTGDLVSSSGSNYACITGCTGVTPVDGVNWQLISNTAGATGSQISTHFAKTPVGPNMFNQNTVTAGYYVNYNNGQLVANASYWASDFIPIQGGANVTSSLTLGGGAAGYAFYDLAQVYISGAATITANTPVAAPASAVYMRLSFASSSNLPKEMLVIGSTLPITYTPATNPFAMTPTGTGLFSMKLPIGQNLFNSATVFPNNYIQWSNGVMISFSGLWATDYIPVAPGTTITTSQTIGNGSVAGYAWYDQYLNYISGVSQAAAGSQLTVPTNAVFLRGSLTSQNIVNTEMIVNGSTVPSGFVPFYPPNTLGTATANAVQSIYNSLPTMRNLFDQSNVVTESCLNSAGGIAAQTGFHVSQAIPVVPGTSYVLAQALGGNSSFKTIFYDASSTFLAYGPDLTAVAGTTFTAPAGAYTYRLCEGNGVKTTQMLTIGTTPPGSYVPFGWGTGSTSSGLSGTISNTSLYNSLPTTRNLFDVSQAILNAYIASNGTLITGFSGYTASNSIPVVPGVTYTIAQPMGGNPVAGGSAFYDSSGAFLVAGPTFTTGATTPPGPTFTAPANAYTFRFSWASALNATQMLTIGATPPSSYVPFGWNSSGGSAGCPAATSGKRISYLGDSITQFYRTTGGNGPGWGTQITSRLCTSEAYVDARGGRTTQQQFEYYGGFMPYPSLNGSITSFSISSNTITINGTFPQALPVNTIVKLVGMSAGSYLTPLRLTVQAGATTTSLSATATYGGTAWTHADVGTTSDTGTAAPILPNGTITSISWVSATNTVTVNGTFPVLPTGTSVGFTGLTTNTWLQTVPGSSPTTIACAVQAGATVSIFTATCLSNGAALSHADVGNTSDTGTVITPGHNVMCVYNDSTHNFCQPAGGVVGNTYYQDITATNPDMIISFLGTNDSARSIGNSSDIAGAASEYGDIKAVIEASLTAKPTVHLMWVTPYLKNHTAIVTAIATASAQYGVPVLNTLANSLMDGAFTSAANLLDGVHPSATGQVTLGGIMAQFISNNF